jgi:hypothetical protein
VLSGIGEGETIVVAPGEQVRDGSRLEIIETVAVSWLQQLEPAALSNSLVQTSTEGASDEFWSYKPAASLEAEE